jgi:hypothetical protein
LAAVIVITLTKETDMVRLVALLVTLTALLSSCSTYPDTSRERFASLPQHYSQFDLKLAWEVRDLGGSTVVDGIVRNTRYAYMYDLEIWVAVLDNVGRVVARSVDYIVPQQLNEGYAAPFSVKLPIPAPPGTRLRFTYMYRGNEGGDGGGFGIGGIPWMQSFEIVVPAR